MGVPSPRLSWLRTVSSFDKILLLDKSCTVKTNFLHSPISSCFSSPFFRQVILDQFRRLIAWSSSFTPHHDLFRGSQASAVCFEDGSVSLFFVLKLVGIRILSLVLIQLFPNGSSDQSVPVVFLCRSVPDSSLLKISAGFTHTSKFFLSRSCARSPASTTH